MKMRYLAILCAFVILIGLGSHKSQAAESRQGANGFCPVLPDERVDPDIYVEHQGKKIYMCCQRCAKKFTAAPQMYLGSLQTIRLQTTPEVASLVVTTSRPEVIFIRTFVQWLGNVHFLVLHFPIALLFVAGISEMMFIWKKNSLFRSFTHYAVLLGAAGAVLTAVLGWMLAYGQLWGADEASRLEWHRWLGTITAVLACVVYYIGGGVRAKLSGKRELAFRLVLLTVFVLVGVASHLGGQLVHGADFLSWPK